MWIAENFRTGAEVECATLADAEAVTRAWIDNDPNNSGCVGTFGPY